MLRHVGRAILRPLGARAYAIPINNVCREWRCKVDGEETAEKLEALMRETHAKLPEGCCVQRMVCKAEWDYKIMTTVSLEQFGEWKGTGFAPEAEVFAQMRAIPGVTNVAAQAYVIDPM